jgi:hypothetical protein
VSVCGGGGWGGGCYIAGSVYKSCKDDSGLFSRFLYGIDNLFYVAEYRNSTYDVDYTELMKHCVTSERRQTILIISEIALINSHIIVAHLACGFFLVSLYLTKVCILSVAVTLPNSVEKKWDSTNVVVQRKLCHFCYKHLFSGFIVFSFFIVYAPEKVFFVLFSLRAIQVSIFYILLYCCQHCSDLNTAFIFGSRRSGGIRFSVKYLL